MTKVLNPALEALNKRIAETNEEFNEASKAKKRMMMAQDVLDRIKVGQLRANTGTFTNLYIDPEDEDKSLKSMMDEGKITDCAVCAKGGVFLSLIGRVNKMKAGEAEFVDIGDEDFIRVMSKVFTMKQLDLIEIAFEGRSFSYTDQGLATSAKADKAKKWNEERVNYWSTNHTTYSKAEFVLRAIMNNIIENKGTFKP